MQGAFDAQQVAMDSEDMVAKLRDALLSITVTQFFPEESGDVLEFLRGVSPAQTRSAFVNEAIKLINWTNGSALIKRLKVFHGFCTYAQQSLGYWVGGFDPDLFGEFPGQTLMLAIKDPSPIWDCGQLWQKSASLKELGRN